MSQALYRKWRPTNFEQVVGQEHVTRTLRGAVAAGRVGHAYLFCGPRGTGKTTTARLLAKTVNCREEDVDQRPCTRCHICRAISDGRFLDLIEIDAASNTGVDDIRDLRDKINFSPSEGRFKVYIIDEVHMLSTAAFNALLKTLEEPPAHAIFILATTEEHKVPLTIKSRCQQFNFRLLTTAEIRQRLQWMAEQEQLSIEPEALEMIARQGAGSVRDAESLLDQLVAGPGDAITLDRAQMVLGTASTTSVRGLVDAWLAGDGAAGLEIIHEALASGADARQFCRQMVTYLRQLLLLRTAGRDLVLDAPVEQQTEMLAQARDAERDMLIEAIKKFNDAAMTPANSWQPQLPLELAFVELLPDNRGDFTVRREAVSEPTHTRPTTASKAAAKAVEPAEDTTAKPAAATPQESPTASPEKAQPVTQPSGSTSALTLSRVTQQWGAMLEEIGRQDRNLPPLLTMSKPLAVEDETLILGFDYPIFKEKFDAQPEANALISDVLKNLLQTPCRLRAVVTSQYVPPVPKDEFEALAKELGGVVKES